MLASEPANSAGLRCRESWAVTRNGPEVFVTVTIVSVNCVCPIVEPVTYGRLSLTVNLKFNVRVIELNASTLAIASPPVMEVLLDKPARIVDNLGKYLVGEDRRGKR